MSKEIIDDFEEPSFEDFLKEIDPISKHLKTILETVDLNAVSELLKTAISFIKSIELSKEDILEALKFFIK